MKQKVAIVHYWLVGMRGGEKMLQALLEMFPDADIFTHVYDKNKISNLINSKKIFTSRIQKFPFAKKLYQLYLPFMPDALMDFDLQKYDLVISSEAGPAKGVVVNPASYHICYCHSPMRYIWDMYHEYMRNANPIVRLFMKCLVPSLRIWDINSANLVDHFVTNSEYVAKRIKRLYRREAQVVFGPAAIEEYIGIKRSPENFYLFFGQITPYKRLDIAIDACIKTNRRLVIAGDGVAKFLRKYQKKNGKIKGLVQFLGRVSEKEAKELLSKARALLYPGIEDLGLIPIEANAAGCPVIAYGQGGALETIKENVTGIFFDEQTSDSLICAIDYFEKNESKFADRQIFSEHVKKFSKEAFIERIKTVIEVAGFEF